jgi:sRNA-binding protein
MPFSASGTGIEFEPATRFEHSSNEPVLPLGSGLTLDRPLSADHAIDAVVRDTAARTAGYEGARTPDQWFGGPALSASAGSMVLRDGAGHVVDSLNYGGLVDPWAGEGYQARSGAGESGCSVATPGGAGPRGFAGFGAAARAPKRSAGRVVDGLDSDSNCGDFALQSVTSLAAPAAAGATNVKVASVESYRIGQTILVDTGASRETAIVANVGTPGATTAATATPVGATFIPVASLTGFGAGQSITVGSGATRETATIAGVTGGRRRFGADGGLSITVAAPLTRAHAAGAEVAGTGITLRAPLSMAHESGAQIADHAPTPGAPNRYTSK